LTFLVAFFTFDSTHINNAKVRSTSSVTNREMPVLVASGLSHEEFHDHIVSHNSKKKV
jgi:hypothetical protein